MSRWDITDHAGLCHTAETLASDAWLTGAHLVQLVLGTATIGLSVYIVAKGLIASLPMHANLKIVGVNILILYCLVCVPQIVMNVWYQVMFRVYQDPCDLLIPSWIGLCVQGPVAIYMISFPLWHVVTCIERAWATFRAQTYEKTSYTYGIICSVAVWTISSAYCACVIYLATRDRHFFDVSYYIVLTKGTNTELLLGSSYALLGIDACSCIADGLLLYFNRKKLRRTDRAYSLSRSYQVHENLATTSRLILPLDLLGFAYHSAYIAGSIWSRSVRRDLLPHQYYCVGDWLLVIAMMQMLTSHVVLIRMRRSKKAPVTVVPLSNESALYFENFRRQVGYHGSS